MFEITPVFHEKAVLVGVLTGDEAREVLESHLDELERLAESAGAQVLKKFVVRRERIDAATYIGSGKVEEILAFMKEGGANLVIFNNNELSPSQATNLQTAFNAKVLDRTELILDIFAKRAKTQEGKLQVEIAQLEYMLPRLVGCWSHFSRQEGGIGTRGPGETQLEIDRRRVHARIKKLHQNLEEVRCQRQTQRKARRRQENLKTVAIAGYTNAGKSTLLQTLTGTETYVADKLFATLDPLAKRIPVKDLPGIVVIDTVGFLRGLPHGLVEAFKATLEEVHFSDLVLHVIDGSSELVDEQVAAVNEVLREIDAEKIPRLEVVNKIDLLNSDQIDALKQKFPEAVFVSARREAGIPELIRQLRIKLKQDFKSWHLRIPQSRAKDAARLFAHANVTSKTYEEEFIDIHAEMSDETARGFGEFLVE